MLVRLGVGTGVPVPQSLKQSVEGTDVSGLTRQCLVYLGTQYRKGSTTGESGGSNDLDIQPVRLVTTSVKRMV